VRKFRPRRVREGGGYKMDLFNIESDTRKKMDDILSEDYSDWEGYTCQDCREAPVCRRFAHLHNGEFFLCEICFIMADHESDYGDDFDRYEPGEQYNNFTGYSTIEEEDEFEDDDDEDEDDDDEDDLDEAVSELIAVGTYRLLT